MHIAIRRRHVTFIYEIIRWCVAKNFSASQAEIENSVEHLTPFMTAVLREQFEVANQLLKNNLATRGYVNREGRDVRQIAEDAKSTRALAYLDNRDGGTRPAINREASMDTLPSVETRGKQSSPIILNEKSALDHARKGSIDPILNRKDDIFGNSYNKEMHQNQNQEPPKIQLKNLAQAEESKTEVR